jgi:hypothetical protein
VKKLDNNPVGGFHQLAPWLCTGGRSIIRVFFVAHPARSILIRKDWCSDYLSVPIHTLHYLFVRRARTEPWPTLWKQRKSGGISAEWNKQAACGRWISLLIMPPKTPKLPALSSKLPKGYSNPRDTNGGTKVLVQSTTRLSTQRASCTLQKQHTSYSPIWVIVYDGYSTPRSLQSDPKPPISVSAVVLVRLPPLSPWI